jgi:sigma-B regulation protein RsbQ
MLLAHGFGCDQNMWRFIVPAFADEYRVVVFDHVGAGKSDPTRYSSEKYGDLGGYADDVLDIVDAVGGGPVIFVGHSVSAMIGVLAAIRKPAAFERLILIGPSPCYVNDGDYMGGFSRADIEALLSTLDNNYLGWSTATAPVIMGNLDRPELAGELADSFCRTNPDIAKQFARVTFLSDNRGDLARVTVPTVVVQCAEDVIAPDCVGQFVADHIPRSAIVRLSASGHCPHMSAPEETIAAMRQFLSVPL